MNGLDLFSGIGGLSVALAPWVRPVCYVELDPYCQAVLVDRMFDGDLRVAPIWDDVRTLDGKQFHGSVDICYGGFPCQDLSVAGRGAGLEGKRSGLFFEILRLAKQIQPTFLFLENVPAIRTRGLDIVVRELSDAGYDARWGALSAYDVGAPHKRERWFLLAANANGVNLRDVCGGRSGAHGEGARKSEHDGSHGALADASISGCDPESAHLGGSGERSRAQGITAGSDFSRTVGDSNGTRLEVRQSERSNAREEFAAPFGTGWWAVEPDVDRVADGIPARVDRLKSLGNAVVPAQAREAFKRLMGWKND